MILSVADANFDERKQKSTESPQQSLATGKTASIDRLNELALHTCSVKALARAPRAQAKRPGRLAGPSDILNYTPNKLVDSLLHENGKWFGDESQTPAQQVFSEMSNRLYSLFGAGWFFEWPRGKRPLNSTWPWADVKPSLLVLWGVCWMFVVTPILEVPGNNHQRRSQSSRPDQSSSFHQGQHGYYYTQKGGKHISWISLRLKDSKLSTPISHTSSKCYWPSSKV